MNFWFCFFLKNVLIFAIGKNSFYFLASNVLRLKFTLPVFRLELSILNEMKLTRVFCTILKHNEIEDYGLFT